MNMARILVVDDESDLEVLIKQKFRKQIREQQYEFLFATDGKKALEVIDTNENIDLLLSDINMPEMDGLTLLSAVGEKQLLMRSVIVSAYGDMQNIRTAMNRGAFDFLCKPINFEDLDVTISKTLQYVEQMKSTIEAIKENNILRMYVDQNVLNFMTRRKLESSLFDNETLEATVIFIDICSFTSISENESPDQVVKLLNSYFDVMVREIIAQGGYIDKFIGDAIMAIFKGDYHLDRAIDSAIAVRNQINSLPDFVDKIIFKPQVSIGINSGEMISGNIGSASLKRLDYTVIGDTVNVAQRLQSAAGPGKIYITESSWHKVRESFQCKKVGDLTLKNKLKPESVYEVVE
jgi:class 3 adenylate cyclase/FixJ family two-component response regulator